MGWDGIGGIGLDRDGIRWETFRFFLYETWAWRDLVVLIIHIFLFVKILYDKVERGIVRNGVFSRSYCD